MEHRIELLIHDMTSAELNRRMTNCLSSQINDGLIELGAPVLKLGGTEQILLAVVSSSALTALAAGIFTLIRRPSKIVLEGPDGTKLIIEADRVDTKKIKELADIARKLSSASLRVESKDAASEQG